MRECFCLHHTRIARPGYIVIGTSCCVEASDIWADAITNISGVCIASSVVDRQHSTSAKPAVFVMLEPRQTWFAPLPTQPSLVHTCLGFLPTQYALPARHAIFLISLLPDWASLIKRENVETSPSLSRGLNGCHSII